MKIAILSDIHANWQALEAVLRDCPEVDETLCLGDVVGYGGDPKRCIDEVELFSPDGLRDDATIVVLCRSE